MPRSKAPPAPSPLMVRLDDASKQALARAAELRGVSVSDYVRLTTVAQARKEVAAAAAQTIALTPDEQFAFWTALAEPVALTDAQIELGRRMRGES